MMMSSQLEEGGSIAREVEVSMSLQLLLPDLLLLLVTVFDVAIRTAVRIETNCYTDFRPNNRQILLCGKWRTTFSVTGGISLNFGQRPKTDPF